jgi:hypothetical protein
MLEILMSDALLSNRRQGDIVGREYIHSCKFLYPYGTSFGDSTIVYSQTTALCPATSEAGAKRQMQDPFQICESCVKLEKRRL